MVDIVDRATRSRMMAGIRGKDTKPELLIRKALHAAGFRYRLHAKLPGRPDIVLPKHGAAIFVHGCFWHGHDCHLFKWPATRQAFWKQKIEGNRARDARNLADLRADGWRILTVWECAIKGRAKMPLERVVAKAATWLGGGRGALVLAGRRAPR